MAAAGLVILSAGRAEAALAPALGGSVARFRWTSGGHVRDWLRPARDDDLASGDPGRLACFPLVPYSNRIREGRFSFGTHAVRLPLNARPERHSQHGHGWQAAWDVAERSRERAVLVYEHAADAWPFSYRARQEFTLADTALTMTISVENTSRETMPVGLGFHPYFPASARCRLRARVARMWATDDEVMPTALTDPDRRLGSDDGMPIAGSSLDNVFTGWDRAATIVWPETNARLALEASAPLDFLVVYSPPGEDFFCAEPVSHCTDAFNLAAQGRADTGILTLRAGARIAATLCLTPDCP